MFSRARPWVLALAAAGSLACKSSPPTAERFDVSWRWGEQRCHPESLAFTVYVPTGTEVEVAGVRDSVDIPTEPNVAFPVLLILPWATASQGSLEVRLRRGRAVGTSTYRFAVPRERLLTPEDPPEGWGVEGHLEFAAIGEEPMRVVGVLAGSEVRFTFLSCGVADVRGAGAMGGVNQESVTVSVPSTAFLSARISEKTLVDGTVGIPLTFARTEGPDVEARLALSLQGLAGALFSGVPDGTLPKAPSWAPHAPLVVRFNDVIDVVHPAAPMLGDIGAVAVEEFATVTLETCRYSLSGDATTREFRLQRLRHDAVVRVVEVRTGRTVAARRFTGEAPPACPPFVEERETSRWGSELDGSYPMDAVRAWLGRL